MQNRILNQILRSRKGHYCHCVEVSDLWELETIAEGIIDEFREYGENEIIEFLQSLDVYYLGDDPEMEKALYGLAVCAFEAGQPARAARLAEVALRVNPQFDLARTLLEHVRRPGSGSFSREQTPAVASLPLRRLLLDLQRMLQVLLGYVLLGALIARFALLFTAGGPCADFPGRKPSLLRRGIEFLRRRERLHERPED